MKSVYAAALLLAATVSATDSESCANPLKFGGNYYCSEAKGITYKGVGASGSYHKITNMDSSNGVCTGQKYKYSGPLSPLDEGVSMHFRGPIKLSKFSAFVPSASSKKFRRSERVRRQPLDDSLLDSEAAANSRRSTSVTWDRIGHYDASRGVSDGIVFLNHFGGSGSGVSDSAFGASLSYASADGLTGSSTNHTLADTTLPSDAEIVIMRDEKCAGENDGCGYYRPGTVAYHGFDGASKAFLLEFKMPSEGGTTTSKYNPVNMPAVWMLNAQIPRTVQYGKADCSCWITGCGEFDIFEVLTSGYTKAKSTLHGNVEGGSSYWFQRPENELLKVGVVMYNDNIHVKVLSDTAELSKEAASALISNLIDSTSQDTDDVSVFHLVGGGNY